MAATEVYVEISLEEALKLSSVDYKHGAHVMLYAVCPGAFCDKYPYKYAIMVSIYFLSPSKVKKKKSNWDHHAKGTLCSDLKGQ